jgi:excisionase family DNA binding protein
VDNSIALSIKDFCQNYGVGRSLTYQLIGAGTLEAKKLGAKTLIDRASADAWYSSLPSFGPARRITKMREAIAEQSSPIIQSKAARQ